MLLSRSLQEFPFGSVRDGSVATIGAFDGLHLGHQDLLDRVLREARIRSLPSVVVSFEPTPKEYFSSESPPARLMRFREKFEALRDYGIDIFFCPRFDDAMRNIAADTFIRQLLVHTLNVRHLEIGDDFRFARGRSGTTDHLQRAGNALDFTVHRAQSVEVDGERVSSTGVREALWSGDMRRATRLLGRP